MGLIHNGRLARSARTVLLGFCSLAGVHLPGANAGESSWYSRDLPGLAEYYFGWFGAVRASQEGIVFTGGDFPLEVLGMHDPKKPKTKFSPLDWILKAGTEVTVPLGAEVSFLHDEAARFALTPLSEDLEQWGFMAMFRARVRLRGDPVVDRALILMLRQRNSPDRRICVLPNDLELARQIVADGGYVPEGATTNARGVFVVEGKSPSTRSGAGEKVEARKDSSLDGEGTVPAITTNAQTEPQSEALPPAPVATKTRWFVFVAALLLLGGILLRFLRK